MRPKSAEAIREAFYLRALTQHNLAAILAGYVVGLATVQVCVIGLSLLRIGLTQPLAISVVGLALGAGWSLGLWLWRRDYLSDERNPVAEESRNAKYLAWMVMALGSSLFAFLLFEAWLKPDFSWDGPAYHVPAIHFWAAKGYIHIVEHDPELGVEGIPEWMNALERILNAFPFAVETCAWVLTTASNNSDLVNIPNLIYAPLGIFGLAYLTRALGTGPLFSMAAGFIFLFLPVTVQQASSTMVDAGFAAAVIGMLALASHMILGFALREARWNFAVPVGCAIGLAIGAKVSGPVLAVSCGGVLGLSLMASSIRARAARGRACRETALLSSSDAFLLRGIICLAVVSLCAIMVGGFWNLRNYIHYGNPMWPAKISVAGHDLFPHAQERANTDLDKQFPVFKLWLQGGIGREPANWPKSIRDHSNWHGGSGYLWILGCVPAIGAALVASLLSIFKGSGARMAKPSFGVHLWPLVLICIVGLAIVPGAGRARYSYWIYGLGIPCFFWLSGCILIMRSRLIRPWSYLPKVWVFFCLGLALFEGLYCAAWWGTKTYAWSTGQKWPPFREAPVRALRTLYWHDPVGYHMPPLSCTVFDDILRGTDAVALHRMQDPPLAWLLIGQLCKPIAARRIYFIGNEVLSDKTLLADQIKKHDIRYVIVEYNHKVPKEAQELASRWYEIPYHFWVLEFAPGFN